MVPKNEMGQSTCVFAFWTFLILLPLLFLFWGAFVFRNRFLYGFMFVCMYVCIYIYICQDGGAVGFIDFTKLSFTLSSLAQPFGQMGSIPEYVFVILSQRKAYAGRFQKETAGKRTGPITKWPP